MKVIKFGGTSQSVEGYIKLIDIIHQSINKNEKIVIVLSAVSGVTNLLEKYLQTNDMKYIDEATRKNNNLIGQLNDKFGNTGIDINTLIMNLFTLANEFLTNNNVHLKAQIIGYGEVLSTNIFYQLVKNIDSQIVLGDSYHFIKTRKETCKLYPCLEFYCSDLINDWLKIYDVIITQGFIASTPSNKPIILGRGGSDTTGALIANAANATEYQVWTDVNGIYTADPRIVKDAVLMKEVKYDLVQEMAGMGAKVMHPYSILPCQQKNIPIKLFNTFSDNLENTIISNSKDNVFCVTAQKNIMLFKITSLCMWDGYGFVYDIFKRFSDKKVNVNIITTSQFTISTTTDETDTNILNELYEELGEKYQVEMTNNSIVSLVSNNLKMYDEKINLNKIMYQLVHYSPNNMTISYVVESNITEHVIKQIHDLIK
jgi:aspartate kinase